MTTPAMPASATPGSTRPAPMPLRILLCNSQIPFVRGGAELLVESLGDELRRRGHAVDTVSIPFSLSSRQALLESALAWRLVDVQAVADAADLVIATRFPSYLVRHPHKVVWLIHQLRQVYDMYGSRYSDFDAAAPRDRQAMDMVRAMDRRTLSEARRLFAISENTAERLRRFNGLDAEVLYPPPKLGDALRPLPAGEEDDGYLFSVGRLDAPKRFDLLLEALAAAPQARAVIAGTGGEADRLARRAADLGVTGRVRFAGWVADDELARLYRRCRAVVYVPYDEDYGYVTVEGMRCAKPVVTCRDSGGTLEFVEDGVNGLVCEPSGRALGRAVAAVSADGELARRLGEAGRRQVAGVTWDRVIDRLLGRLETGAPGGATPPDPARAAPAEAP
jgi:glycosyltransferase involved in cell wall biosynthesis